MRKIEPKIQNLTVEFFTPNNTMKYLAAYLLLVNAGNAAPSAADIKKVLESVSIEVEDEKVDQLLAEVDGKNVEELIAEGTEKLSAVPTGAPAASGAAAGGAAPEAAAEEKEEEAAEESDDDMGFGLFD
ncbi:60S acidic ribosomal protein P2-A [Candidozyma auris]|nr:60S acidic ribosomal protein P2-A [[Candida] auris]